MKKDLPISPNKKFKYSISFESWDEESLEAGQSDVRGYEVDDNVEAIGDILYEANTTYGIYMPVSFGNWESTEPEEDRDFWEKGIRKYYTLHITNDDGTQISQEENDFITYLLSDGRYEIDKFREYAVGGVVLGSVALGVGALITYFYFKGKKGNKNNRAKSVTHIINGKERKYPIKDAWRKDHNLENKSQKFEVPQAERFEMGGDASEHYHEIEYGEGGVARAKEVITKKIGLNEGNADFLVSQSEKFSIWLADVIVKKFMIQNSENKKQTLENINRHPDYISRFYRSEIREILDWLQHPVTPKQDLKQLSFDQALEKAREWHQELQVLGGDIDFTEPEKNTIIKTYPKNSDGIEYYWVFIPSNYCDLESSRMGHCGRTGYGNNLISLRSVKPYGKGHTINDSHITIAYGVNDGFFYQVKGKKNNKPAEKYFPYIFDLIKTFITDDATSINSVSDVVFDFSGFGSEYGDEEDYGFEDMTNEELLELYDLKPNLFDNADGYLMLFDKGIISSDELKKIVEENPETFESPKHQLNLYNLGIVDTKPSFVFEIVEECDSVGNLLNVSNNFRDDLIENILCGDTNELYDGWSYYYENPSDLVNNLNKENEQRVIDEIVRITGLDESVVKENGIEHYLNGDDEDFTQDDFDNIIRVLASAQNNADNSDYYNYLYKELKNSLEELGEVHSLNDEGVRMSIDLTNFNFTEEELVQLMEDYEFSHISDLFYELKARGDLDLPSFSIDDRYSPYGSSEDFNDYVSDTDLSEGYEKGGSLRPKNSKIKNKIKIKNMKPSQRKLAQGGNIDSNGISKEDYYLVVNNWVYFTFNYPMGFVKDAFNSNHLEEKFSSSYERYGSVGVLMSFWANLDGNNREILSLWIKNNYFNSQSQKEELKAISNDNYAKIITHWNMFCFNFPYGFIENVYGENTSHFEMKWVRAYESAGSTGAVNKFYTEMSSNNQRLLTDWVYDNYKGVSFADGGRVTTNEGIIEAFLTSNKELKVGNLTTHYNQYDDFVLLRNYHTLIATRKGNDVSITNKKHSNTTTTITNKVRSMALNKRMNVNYVEKFADGGEVKSFLLGHNELSSREGMHIGFNKGDLMKMAYGENYTNVDSALPIGLLDEMGIGKENSWHYVMDYNTNSFGEVTDLFEKITAKNPNVEVFTTDYELVETLPILQASKKYANQDVLFQLAKNQYASGGEISVYDLRKGDKIRTRKGDIETIERKIESGYFTKESEYSHPFESIEFVERPKKQYAGGGNIKGMNLPESAKIRINYVDVSVYLDSYEEGETENVNNYDMNDIKGRIVSPKELVKFLSENIYTSEDTSDYVIIDNNIHTSQLQDEDGSEASESEKELWKKGEIELYSANFVISVSVISELEVDDETLSSLTGIGIYEEGGSTYADGGEAREFNYLYISEVPNGLKLELTEEGINAYNDEEIYDMYDLFEDVQGNSEMAYIDNAGDMGFGLTEAPIITDGYYYDDNGDFTDEGHTDSKVYVWNDYMIKDLFATLMEQGSVVLTEVKAEGGEADDDDEDEEYAGGGDISDVNLLGDNFEEVGYNNYARNFGVVQIGGFNDENDINILVSAVLTNMYDATGDDEFEEKPYMWFIETHAYPEFWSDEYADNIKDMVGDDEINPRSLDFLSDAHSYGLGVPLSTYADDKKFATEEEAIKFLNSKRLNEQISGLGMLSGFHFDKAYNRIGDTGWKLLYEQVGASEEEYAGGGELEAIHLQATNLDKKSAESLSEILKKYNKSVRIEKGEDGLYKVYTSSIGGEDKYAGGGKVNSKSKIEITDGEEGKKIARRTIVEKDKDGDIITYNLEVGLFNDRKKGYFIKEATWDEVFEAGTEDEYSDEQYYYVEGGLWIEGGRVVDYDGVYELDKRIRPLLSALNLNSADVFEDGGSIYEEPIGIMKPISGKVVGSVPVSEDVRSSQIKEFVDYVYDVYNEEGFTKAQVKSAVNKYIADLEKEFTWGGGDSLDRERVYEYLLNPKLKNIKNPTLFAEGGRVTKFVRVFFVQGNYGQGWEDLTAHDDWKDAKAEKIDYDKNERNYGHRVIERRVLRSDYEKGNYAKGGEAKKYAKGGMFGEGARLEYVTDAYASDEMQTKLKKKLKIKTDALGDNYVISFAYTDYGGDFLDKVAIAYFTENYPNNIIKENAGYNGENAYVFGEPAQEWIEQTEDYPLGFEDIESFYYEKQAEQESEDFAYFLDELTSDYSFDKESVMDWLQENRGGYYGITTQGLDFSYEDLTEELINEGLIEKIDDNED